MESILRYILRQCQTYPSIVPTFMTKIEPGQVPSRIDPHQANWYVLSRYLLQSLRSIPTPWLRSLGMDLICISLAILSLVGSKHGDSGGDPPREKPSSKFWTPLIQLTSLQYLTRFSLIGNQLHDLFLVPADEVKVFFRRTAAPVKANKLLCDIGLI